MAQNRDKVLPYYRDFDGVVLCGVFDDENVRSAREYQPKPGDRFVATYPKCGTTWTQMIILLIANDGRPPDDIQELYIHQPFIEFTGTQHFSGTPAEGPQFKPLALKTHFSYEMTPMSPEARYLYIVRNPKDACVSFFHHTQLFDGYRFVEGTFDDYFDLWIEGKVDYGDYFEHVAGW